jgi:O-antigen ligase
MLFFVLCFSLSFIGNRFYAIPNGINILLVLLFPFVIDKQTFIKNILKKPIVCFAAFLLFVLFKSIFLGHFLEDLNVIKKLFQILLLLILSFGLKRNALEQLKSGIIFGCLFAVIYSLIKITLIITETGSFNFSNGPIINETLPIQRLYLGLLCVISLILVIDRFFKMNKKVYLFLAIIFGSFVFLISARIAIITTVIVLLYYVQLKMYKKYKLLTLLFLGLFTFLFFLKSPNLSKRILDTEYKTNSSIFERILTQEPRYLIWKYSYSILNKNQLLFGYGFKGVKIQLLKKYEEINDLNKRNWFIQEQFNSHNQYLDILLTQGIIGLALFLIFLYYLYKESLLSDTNLLLFLTLAIFLTIYNNFYRVIGVFIFAIIFCIIVRSKKPSLDE